MKPKLKRYLISISVGLLCAFIIMMINDIFEKDSASEVFRILSDSFFVSGVGMTGFGIILFSSSQGLFDMISYGLKTFFQVIKNDHKGRKYKDFYEYKQARHSEKRESNAYLFIVGLSFIAVAAVCLTVFCIIVY